MRKGSPHGAPFLFDKNKNLMPASQQRFAERLKQGSVDGIALRIIFRMPLHAERKARRFGNPYRLDRAVHGNTFDHHAFAGLQDTLSVQ